MSLFLEGAAVKLQRGKQEPLTVSDSWAGARYRRTWPWRCHLSLHDVPAKNVCQEYEPCMSSNTITVFPKNSETFPNPMQESAELDTDCVISHRPFRFHWASTDCRLVQSDTRVFRLQDGNDTTHVRSRFWAFQSSPCRGHHELCTYNIKSPSSRNTKYSSRR